MCGGYRKVRCYFSEAVHLGFFLRKGFSLAWSSAKSARLVGQQASGICSSLPPSGVLRLYHTLPYPAF